MSKSTLQLAAGIRDENRESANTAMRVGKCLEAMITEFDDFSARFPISRIPALVIDISMLDAMNTAEYARLDDKGIGGYFLVTRLTGGGIPLNIGTLEIFSDDSHHVITQIFKTHATLSPGGTFTAGHDHNHIYIYTRTYGLSASSQTAGPGYFPLHGWGKWRPMTAIAPEEEPDGAGMAGLMSAADKQKLYKLSADVENIKKTLEELKKITLITQ